VTSSVVVVVVVVVAVVVVVVVVVIVVVVVVCRPYLLSSHVSTLVTSQHLPAAFKKKFRKAKVH
jgi:hypothetical protein